jgi:hypothetical protein
VCCGAVLGAGPRPGVLKHAATQNHALIIAS